MVVGVALLGAGIFATDQHLPAIQSCSDFSLKAVYSRSQASAQSFAALVEGSVDVYYESPSQGSHSLDALLSRTDIEAIIIAVPIYATADLVRKALSAGKHVLSEKPIAPDVQTAQSLLNYYEEVAAQKTIIWAVGENFRFWNPVVKAMSILQEMKAELTSFSCHVYHFVGPENKFVNTEWRKNPLHQGGWLLDGGIHFTAILRDLLSTLGQKIVAVSAATSLIQPNLSPFDTIHATLQASNGKNGAFIVSNGLEYKAGIEIEVITTVGAVLIRPTQVVVSTKDGGKLVETKHELQMTFGVKEELAEFARSIRSQKLDRRISPQETLADLQLLEAMFKSAMSGGNLQSV